MQCPGNDIAGQNREVQSVQDAGVPEGIENVGRQAKDEEVGRLRCRPAPEEDVKANGKVDQRYDTGDLEVRPVCGFKVNADIKRSWPQPIPSRPEQRVACVGPDPALADSPFRRRQTWRR